MYTYYTSIGKTIVWTDFFRKGNPQILLYINSIINASNATNSTHDQTCTEIEKLNYMML